MSTNAKDGRQESEDDDLVQKAMGSFGLWQAVICTAISFLKVSVAWHQLAIVFLAPPQDFWCARPPDSNISVEWWRNVSSPSQDGCKRFNFSMNELNMNDGIPATDVMTIPCSQWEFDTTLFTSTIVSTWDLVCHREVLQHVSQTVFMFGILIGNFFFGLIADKFGRKNPLLCSVALQVVAGVATAFCTNFHLFLVVRFMDAFATGGSMVTSFVICMELVGKKWRAFVAVLYHIPFSIGHLTLPGVAYYLRDWRHFQLAISLPSLMLLSYYWLVPESPRWLLTVGRVNEAKTILKSAAKYNKLHPSLLENMLAKRTQDAINSTLRPAKGSFFDLLRYPNLRKKTFCISFNWIVCGVCFFGLAQYLGQIGGNIFINVALGGMIEVPGSFVCIYAMQKFGRRKTLISSQFLAGLACICVVFTPSGAAGVWPTVALSTIGIVGMSVSFPTVYLYSGELFPTVVRNVGIGFASMTARFGSMAAPFISGLSTVGVSIPPIVFGVFPLVGAFLCFFLPETLNTTLPDTIEDGEACGLSTTMRNKKLTGIENNYFKETFVQTKI